ncbi:acyl-CoA dehydrogenase [Pedobacter sp. HMF7647]|uniref:Acyl-CoA dehydrogenase n=1 Tax=Hufsiella arboris TaxID=2695275 RepID=A0A7K1Y7B5_9SPHI|nr:acyl-CoA dehydrogenase [Hufsiella arboris]MXV50455.1 acyl-CoA dehydrogenase [Hufsiella arboris]
MNVIADHPSKQLTSGQADLIRNEAPEAEKISQLTPKQLGLIYDQRWFNAYIPKELGGLELSLPKIVKLEEALSWADGSLGWTMTLCSGAAFFAGYLDKQLAAEIFSDKKTILAGSGASTGTADITDDGFIVNGNWLYASGILHATHLTANCIIRKNNIVQKNEDGSDMIRSFIFRKEEATILPGWNYMGLKATGSHWYEVRNLTVPKNRMFCIDPEHATDQNIIFNYPFLQLAEATLVANFSGMAIHFLELAEVCVQSKNNLSNAKSKYIDGKKEQLLNDFNIHRGSFFKALDASWNELETRKPITEETLKNVSTTSRKLAHSALKLVDDLYPFCGMQAANSDSEINRVWRDIHTASQHSLLTFPFN